MDLKPARDALAAADAPRLRHELRALFPTDGDLNRLDELVYFAVNGGVPPSGFSSRTELYLNNMAVAQELRRRGPDAWVARRHRAVPKSLNFLADLGGVDSWSLPKALNRLTLELIEPKPSSCALVGTLRDDGIYILEWVAHYLALGFEHLFVYTNDNADGSDELLAALAAQGILTVMDNEVSGEVPPEAKAFGHALDLVPELRNYEWALFVDSDEFLILGDQYHHSTRELLAAVAADPKPIGAIVYDWLWFVSGMKYEREGGPLYERFQHARPHFLSKCLVRLSAIQSMRRQHIPELAPGSITVDSALEPMDLSVYWERRQAQYAGGRINHYWPKSFQEFIVKKARGAALAALEGQHGNKNNLYDRPYDLFFVWNGRGTPENAYPADPGLLDAVKAHIHVLRTLPGVAEAADRIERGFGPLLARVGDDRHLRQLYAQNAADPGDL